jgi:ribosomal protein L11 methyltransferase
LANWPALDVHGVVEPDLVLALVDDFSPTALEERGDVVRIFFPSPERRDAALHDLRTGALAGALAVHPVDVDDEDWARRSQANLQPIAVGRITVSPSLESPVPAPGAIHLVIQPSMGFGTGHHATTRLCLEALQTVDVRGAKVLDVGTGSGILAIAAASLGAAHATGVDNDPDALAAATENLALNPDVRRVEFRLADVSDGGPGPHARIVLANLTGALLVREAASLKAAVDPDGWLILSGILAEERDAVVEAFRPMALTREARQDEWVCLTLRRR